MSYKATLLKLETDLSYHDIYLMLLNNSYSEDNGRGFMLNKLDKNLVSGKHILKNTKEIKTEDPFGNTKTHEEDIYTINNFTIFGDNPKQMQIHNPARMLSAFRNDLGVALKFKCAIDSVQIDIERFTSLLMGMPVNLNITSIDIDSIYPFPNTTAKVKIIGSDNLINKSKEFIGNRKSSIEKASIEFNINEEQVSVEVSRKGRIYFSCDITKKTREEIINKIYNL